MPTLWQRLKTAGSVVLGRSTWPPGEAPRNDLHDWARDTVEKVRVATMGGRLRFLPWHDPYTEETQEIRSQYPVMLREPTVKAAFLTKVLSVCQLPVQLHPQDPDHPRHREAAEFATYALKQVGRPHRHQGQRITSTAQGTAGIAWNVLHGGIILGHSVCEKVWATDPLSSGRWAGKRLLAAIKAKDTNYLHLGIDAYRNVEAIRGSAFSAGQVWEPEGFVVWSFLSLFENPTGMSDFRAAYRAYWIKDTSWKLRALFLDKYASGPYLKGTYTTPDIKEALETALENARANTWISVPQGAMVEMLDLAQRGTSDFQSAIADCDKEMLIAIVGAHLQVLEGQVKGARGDTEVHQETSELFQWMLAESLAGVYQSQILPDLYEENFWGVEPADVSLGAISTQEIEAQARLFKAAQDLGLPLSRKKVYHTLSLDEPEDDDDTLEPPAPGGGGDQPPGGSGGGEGGEPAASPFSESPADAETVEDDPDQFADLMAEILYGLYGAEALELFAAASEDDAIATAAQRGVEAFAGKWNALHHPRGPNGRFIAKGSPEAQARATEVIGAVLRGDTTSEGAEKVAEHLAILTVKQLRGLHRQHGQKIPARLREELVAAVKQRLPVPKPTQPARTIESYGISPREADNLRAIAQKEGVDPTDVAKRYAALSRHERRTGWDLMMRALSDVKATAHAEEDFSAYSDADWEAFDAKDWQPYKLTRGPNKGKSVWKHKTSGKISHDDPAKKAKEASNKKATADRAKKDDAEKAQKARDAAVADIKAMAADPKKITPARVKAAGAALATMKVAELQALRKEIGAGAGKTKAALVEAIQKRALEKPAKTTPAKPEKKAPAKKTPATKPEKTPDTQAQKAPITHEQKQAVTQAIDTLSHFVAYRHGIMDLAHLRELTQKQVPALADDQTWRAFVADLANSGGIRLHVHAREGGRDVPERDVPSVLQMKDPQGTVENYHAFDVASPAKLQAALDRVASGEVVEGTYHDIRDGKRAGNVKAEQGSREIDERIRQRDERIAAAVKGGRADSGPFEPPGPDWQPTRPDGVYEPVMSGSSTASVPLYRDVDASFELPGGQDLLRDSVAIADELSVGVGTVSVADLYDRLQAQYPGLAVADFHRQLLAWESAGLMNLRTHNDPHLETPEALRKMPAQDSEGRGVQVRGFLRVRPAAKETVADLPAGDNAPEPGFTGTDALGRKWVNGELVAREEEETAAAAGKPEPEPEKTPEPVTPPETKTPSDRAKPAFPPPDRTVPPAQLGKALGVKVRAKKDAIYPNHQVLTFDSADDLRAAAPRLWAAGYVVRSASTKDGTITVYPAEKRKMPATAYHVLPRAVAEKVLAEGLSPALGKSTHHEGLHSHSKVFLHDNPKVLASFARRLADEPDSPEYVMIRVDTSRLDSPAFKDQMDGGGAFFVHSTTVPPEALQIMDMPGAKKGSRDGT